MAKPRYELSSAIFWPLLGASSILFGALTLWLWLVPLRPVFEPSTVTTVLVVVLSTVPTFYWGALYGGLTAMDGRPKRARAPRSATLFCVSEGLVMIGNFAVVPILVNLVAAGAVAVFG